MSDYVFDTRESLDERIAELEERARDARAEADQARAQPGLEGPAKSAESEAARLEAEVADLREIGTRVTRGYPFWERQGFEEAVDACGNACRWQLLSETVADGFIYGHDTEDVRLPLDVQRAYARSLETGLFDRFEICSTFETEGDDVVAWTDYLFAVRELSTFGSASFFVEQWSDRKQGSEA